MRVLFWFLVLLNIGYFVASELLTPASHADRQSADASLPAGVQPLTLIRVNGAAASVDQTKNPGSSSKPSPSAPPALCYSLGPFTEKAKASQMLASLKHLGVVAKVRRLQQTQVTGYWVYLAPYPSAATAAAVARKLDAKGQHDFYVVPSGPKRNAISLGLFIERRGAEKRLAQVREMGYKPKLQVRTSVSELYWLDYRVHGETISPSLWAHAGLNGGALQRLRRECVSG